MNLFQFYDRFPDRSRKDVFGISGDEEQAAIAVRKIVRSYHSGDMDRVTLTSATPREVVNQLSIPIFSGFRTVVVEDASKWREVSPLLSYYQRNGFDGRVAVLRFRSNRTNTENELAQFIIKNGWWVSCRRPSVERLIEFYQDHFGLEFEVADELVSVTGISVQRGFEVLTKSKALSTGKPPDLKQLRACMGASYHSVFGIAELIIRKDYREAYLALAGQNFNRLLSIIRLKCVQYIRCRNFADTVPPEIQRMKLASLAEEVGIPHYLLPSTIQRSKSMTIDGLIHLLDQVGRAEILIHSQRQDPYSIMLRMMLRRL